MLRNERKGRRTRNWKNVMLQVRYESSQQTMLLKKNQTYKQNPSMCVLEKPSLSILNCFQKMHYRSTQINNVLLSLICLSFFTFALFLVLFWLQFPFKMNFFLLVFQHAIIFLLAFRYTSNSALGPQWVIFFWSPLDRAT